jgi:hypothetical protein
MSDVTSVLADGPRVDRTTGRHRAGIGAYAPLAAIVAFALWSQTHFGVDENTSWLINVGERMLDGATPYVDMMETNPPASILLYLPALWAARFFNVPSEFMVDLFCFLSVAVSLAISAAVLSRGGLAQRSALSRLATIAAAILLVLPGRTFDERDHIALVISLPCLAALAVRACKGRVDLPLAVLAGLGAGAAMSIKPHFALFFAPNILYLARRAGWRAVVSSPEPYLAAAVVALYAAAAWRWFPAFFDFMAPLQRDVYVPVRRSWDEILLDLPFLSWLCMAAVLAAAARQRLTEPLVAVLALASLGAAAAFVIQGKGWAYQAYPALALVALAFGALICGTQLAPRLSPRAIGGAATIAFLFAYVSLSQNAAHPRLERFISAFAPHPKLIAIAPSLTLGFPLTRHVQGVWVGRMHSLWITDLVSHALELGGLDEAAKARYQVDLRLDREMLVADIRAAKPDIVLIASDMWKSWALSHADVAAALADYASLGVVDGVSVYSRKDRASKGSDNDPSSTGPPA